MTYIFAILGLISAVCIKKIVSEKNIHDLKEVRNLMATRYPEKTYTNTIRIYWATFVTVNKYYFHHLLRSLDQSVEIKDRNTAILSYTYKGNDYRIAINTRTGPCVVESVLNEKGENVTDVVLPYFGPGRDWHGKVFYPKWWGYEILEFVMHSGNTISFRGKEEINF